jgi:hypothetical protein
VQKYAIPFRPNQKCFTPTLGVNTKNTFNRFFIHQINAPRSCCYLSKVLLQKRDMGYAKVIHKEKKEEKKMDKCLRYLKQWVLRCLPKKR